MKNEDPKLREDGTKQNSQALTAMLVYHTYARKDNLIWELIIDVVRSR